MAFESVLPSLQAVKVLGSAERAALRGRWGISRAAKGERSCPLMSRCCERRTAGGPQVRSRRDGAQRPGRRTGPQGLAQPVRPRGSNTKAPDQHLIQINSACAACSDHHPAGAKRRHAEQRPATLNRHPPSAAAPWTAKSRIRDMAEEPLIEQSRTIAPGSLRQACLVHQTI